MAAKEHRISKVHTDSIGEECGIMPGDFLLSIDGQEIEDIFDYQFLVQSEEISLLTRTAEGEECLFEIEKDEDEDLGLEFEEGLMDEYRSCKNKCIFCFIDQMPPGMRDTLYFKDDDSRLSFLQGNYITLTGLSDHDVDRIIKYHLSPINISFHTMDPALRCEMLHNRFAGESLAIVDRFYEAGIEMNGQIVLCRGINDGDKLDESIEKLSEYIPVLGSLSVVPVGLTRFREGLYPLKPFDKESSLKVIAQIEKWQDILYKKYGVHFVHGGDEWYIMADIDLPKEDSYDGYLQLENGVGMVRLLIDEFHEGLEEEDFSSIIEKLSRISFKREGRPYRITVGTGKLMYPTICGLVNEYLDKLGKIAGKDVIKAAGKDDRNDPANYAISELLTIEVKEVENEFFGPLITVSGLLTGSDIIRTFKDRDLGDVLLLPENILRAGETVLLDDITIEDIEKELDIRIKIVPEDGRALLKALQPEL